MATMASGSYLGNKCWKIPPLRLLAASCRIIVSVSLLLPPYAAVAAERTTQSAPGVNLDLTSIAPVGNVSKALASHNRQAVNITVGGARQQVTTTTLLTASEKVAVYQVLRTGTQSIQLGPQGNATGGTMAIGLRLAQHIGSLVIPHGVTVIDRAAVLNIAGTLTNSGSLYAAAGNPAAGISATNILNQPGGLISTVLPASGLPGITGAVSNLSLNLMALNNIVNAGVISSAGNIANSGLIAAITGNINVACQTAQSLAINNAGGTLAAARGSINIGDQLQGESGDVGISRGNISGQTINVYGQNMDINVDELTGTLNMTGSTAHVIAGTTNLILGNICLTGDPTFYNTTGAVSITGSVTSPGQDLSFVAGTNIISTAAGSINTSSSTVSGGKITLIAGASFQALPTDTSSTSQTAPRNNGDASNTLTITGGTSAGGYIDLTGGTGTGGGTYPITLNSSSTTTGGGNGGDITLVAYGGSGSNAGTINLPTTSASIQCGGSGTGINGNVTMIAGATASGAAAALLQAAPNQPILFLMPTSAQIK